MQHTGWYRAVFDTVWSIFPKLLSSCEAKEAIACSRSGFGKSSFRTKEATIMRFDLAVLPDWVDASADPKKLFT